MSEQARTTESFSQLRHALRTPLNHIIGYAEMLVEDTAGVHESENTASLRNLIVQAQHVCDLIQGLGGSTADAESEVAILRANVRPLVEEMKQAIDSVQQLSSSDTGRIARAIDELSSFAVRGEMPSVASHLGTRSAAASQTATCIPAHLLVVDDDEGNRDILRRHLGRQGHSVKEAGGGAEALRLIEEESFDAVLLDLVMPGMDGFEVLERLKQHAGLADVPVLVISASDDLGAIADSIQRGAEDYLIKPFDPVLLHARLSATLERKRLRDWERLKNAELESLTSALKRSNEDLQRFAYAASHDLQAPVRTITTYIQLLQRRMKSKLNEDEREMFEFAEGAAKRMHTLIQDLLQYSQATSQDINFETVDLSEMVDSLLKDLHSVLKDADAVVDRAALPVIRCDATRVRQVLQNLIGNAVKYRREEPPRVHISVAQDDNRWKICVRDNGQGIPPEHKTRIFEMFQRLHGSEIPGSGIGLAICKRIVERYGGEIWVDESEVGVGSVFCFTVPSGVNH